jgi:hypothetical protein
MVPDAFFDAETKIYSVPFSIRKGLDCIAAAANRDRNGRIASVVICSVAGPKGKVKIVSKKS